MADDVSWTINTNTDGDVTADAIAGGMPTLTRGRTQRIRFWFPVSSQTNYETLREYLDLATPSAVATGVFKGDPRYKELHSDSEELLMSFDPTGSDIPATVTGFWAVLTGGRDRTPSHIGEHVLEFEVFMLAELSEHADRSAAKTAHEQ